MVLELAMEVVKKNEMSTPTVGAHNETLEGLYTLTVTPLNGEFHVRTKWSAAKKNKPKTKRFHKLADDLIYAIERECSKVGLGQTVQVKGFTEMKTLDGDNAVLYRASPWYLGLEWYDFAMVEFVDEKNRCSSEIPISPAWIH